MYQVTTSLKCLFKIVFRLQTFPSDSEHTRTGIMHLRWPTLKRFHRRGILEIGNMLLFGLIAYHLQS